VKRTLVLDAGALIAGDRNDPTIVALVKAARTRRASILLPAGALAEVWRSGANQANLARFLKAVDDVVAIDIDAAKRAGELLGGSQLQVGPIDAHVSDVAIRNAPSLIVTSDRRDIESLLAIGKPSDVALHVV
jgi:predicted nucleic acid-binding protein